MPERQELAVAVLGCGRVSRNHLESIDRMERLRLVAVCDSIPDRAKEAGEAWGVPFFTSYQEMLDRSDAHVVTICTPSGMHAKHTILAAGAGKHVVCEKPMAITLKDADAMVRACDDAGVELFVVKQNRLNETIKLLRSAIAKGRFGRLYMANATVRWTRPQQYYDMAPWRGTWEFDGGAFMNQASHYVDLMQWFMGPVDRVMAQTATLARRIEAEDSGAAILKFRSGALGVLEVTTLTYPKNYEGSITLLGEKGTVRVGGTAVNRIEHWEFEDYDDDDRLVESVNTNPPSVYGFGHEAYYHNVLASLTGGMDPDTDGRDGRKSLELILAIYESARTGHQVPLPLPSGF